MALREQKINSEDIKRRLKSLFADPGLRLIILFGSVATNKMHKRSDIDLAFLFDDFVDTIDLTNKVSRLLQTDSIDVIDARKASPLLKFSIARSGILIYEREKGMFNEFYSLAFRRYIDVRKLRTARESYIRDFLTAKGLS